MIESLKYKLEEYKEMEDNLKKWKHNINKKMEIFR